MQHTDWTHPGMPVPRASRLALGAVLIAGAALAAPPAVKAQEASAAPADAGIAERCRGAEHRQFDFWIGEWEVRNPDGELVGHNTIRRVSRGCALLENWRGASGGRGMSINTYDAERGGWTQRWVGAGSTLWLEGGPEGERMVLAGTAPRATPQGEVLDRITWTPLPDGRVEQRWEISTDEGESWSPYFVGLYEAAGEASGIPAAGAADPGSAASGGAALRFTRITSGAVATAAYSSPSASWVDVDDDGDEDLYVLNGFGSLENPPVPQPNALYRNDGAGRLTPVADHPLLDDVTFSGSATWGDYDNDGDLDAFVANQRGADNLLYRNDGAGEFERVTESPVDNDAGRSFSAAWVDIDGDGLLDLHVMNGRSADGGEVDFVYRNGGGGFERVRDVPFASAELPSGGGAWADFDADGDADLFLPVNATGEPNRMYRNDGGWRFTEIAAEAGLGHDPLPASPATSVAHWVDYDNDGDLDLFVGNSGGTMDFMYVNDGRGRFERAAAGRVGLDGTYVSDALWVDLDNDADLDLLLAVWGGASEVYLNDGAGELRPGVGGDYGAVVTFASSVSAGDIDDDGDLDLYLTQWPINEAGGAPNHMYRNDGRNGNWLKIDLEGTESNRSAIGAVITVTAEIGGEARRQLRHVAARTSWRSANSLTQHFGLGDAETVDRIEVAWPSGRTTTRSGPIRANQRVRILESGGGT